MEMNFRDLLSVVPDCRYRGPADVPITGIAYDSRRVRPGYIFVALPGENFHGLQFLEDARKAGAVAVVSDRDPSTDLPHAVAPNARLALALISNVFYEYPSTKLKLIGVTGTNGKTTTTFLIRSIMEAAGLKCGLIGTIRYSAEQFSTQAAMTTPESLDLHELLQKMLEEDAAACSMEVSSQGLVQYRAAGSVFEAGVFTNLTHEHLDYHKTMDAYFDAKLMLFDNKSCFTRIAVANIDDEYGRRLLGIRGHLRLDAWSFGFRAGADVQIQDWKSAGNGTSVRMAHRGNIYEARTSLIGKYNVCNVTAAFATALSLGIEPAAISRGIENMKQVPGRLERAEFGQPFQIIIDYAHTDDAFRQLLSTLRDVTANRIIHIFGCGGQRDRAKRPLMGKASAELADVVVLTSDNPRGEDPEQIMNEVKKGIEETNNRNVSLFIDRADAIDHAVKIAEPGDTIVITGKGNETYQLVQGQKYPFDEREFFRLAVERHGKASQSTDAH